jgi:glycosyltransferase involved in cell wall biosynthesis
VSRGLRIGIDARELSGHPTGTGRYLRNLLRQWTNSGNEPAPVAPSAGRDQLVAAARDRFLVYTNGTPPDHPLLRHESIELRPVGDGRSRGILWQETELPAAARADSLDVFFSPAYSCPLRLAVPRVTAIHDLSFFSYPSDFGLVDAVRRRLTVGASVRASKALLACSAFTAREIAARFPDAAPRVVHVPLGPDDDLPPARSREEARAARGVRGPLVLTVGAILNRRCLPTLLQAVSLLRRRGLAVSLDVVGENRTHPPLDLPALAARLGLGRSVTFTGYTCEQDLAARYAAADVAVFLSEYEGFGLPALEAASRGLPLVVADRPSLSEVFAGAALFVDPQDAEAVAGAVFRLLADDELRRDLVSRGLALARRLSWAEAARRTRETLAAAARPADR